MTYIINELGSLIKDKYEAKDDQLEILSDFIEYIEKDSDLAIKELKRMYHEMCEEEPQYCPDCKVQLEFQSHEESRGEHFGTPSYETVGELACPDCDYSL